MWWSPWSCRLVTSWTNNSNVLVNFQNIIPILLRENTVTRSRGSVRDWGYIVWWWRNLGWRRRRPWNTNKIIFLFFSLLFQLGFSLFQQVGIGLKSWHGLSCCWRWDLERRQGHLWEWWGQRPSECWRQLTLLAWERSHWWWRSWRMRMWCLRWSRSLVTVSLHETVNLEPVWSSSISWPRFGHPNHQTFSKSASFARGPVLFVHHTTIVILAFCNHWLVIASSTKEWFTSLTSEGSKVESCCWFITHSA